MKRFLKISTLFILPIIILQVFTWLFYSTNKGDLLRMGYIYDKYPDYRNIFTKELQDQKILFNKISENPVRKKYKILTIGDSFSEQGAYGYQNYLSKNNNWGILNFDRSIQNTINNNLNQIEILLYLINGDFFNQYPVEFVILQNIERHFVSHSNNIIYDKSLNIADLNRIILDHNRKEKNKIESEKIKFPSESIFKFPFYTYQYFTKNDYSFENKVNKTKLNKSLFSPNINELLFYHVDLESLDENNDINQCKKLNDLLNLISMKLEKIGIKLIVLPSPDKYDFYFENIVNNSIYPKPLFFENMSSMEKNYIYINSKEVLRRKIDNVKDIYFYDDTHWTPKGSKFIAEEIGKKVKANDE